MWKLFHHIYTQIFSIDIELCSISMVKGRKVTASHLLTTPLTQWTHGIITGIWLCCQSVVKTPFLHSVTWQEDVAMNTFVTVWNSKIQNLFPLKSITATRLQKEWHAYMPAVEKLCMIVNTRHGHNKQKVLHFTDCYSTMFFKRRLTF